MTLSASSAAFDGLVDLAARVLGGRALGCSDDFFAGMHNLLEPGRGVFVEGKYTDRGKWMDGWESRRRRGAGHDWCIVELGAPGAIAAVDIDTNHFLGNHPPFASLEGRMALPGTPLSELAQGPWQSLLPQVSLRPGSQNLFVPQHAPVVSHLRLNIFPDGGVARLRAFGRVHPEWGRVDADAETRPRLQPGWVDLAALRNGALPLLCSDAFFSPMQQLLMPGPAADMGSGWETRRRRSPGHDWMVLKLGARGRPHRIEVDTTHFKGNFPESCSLDGLNADTEIPLSQLATAPGWVPVVARSFLQADHRHFFDALAEAPAVTHLRVNIFPDGGLSRLRVWGTRDE